jgi:signal transduction histidine kinase
VSRIGCALVAFGIFVVGALTTATWLLTVILGGSTGTGSPLVPLGIVVLLVVVIGALGSFRAFGRLARPVAEIIDATQRLADGELTARVAPTGPRPTRQLGESFNRMAERLAAAEDRRRALLADVSHELRTPLTVIGGGLEAMLDGVHPPDAAHLEPLVEETRVLSRLIDDLGTLSLSESGALELRRERVDPSDLITDVVAAFETAAARTGVSLSAHPAPDLPELWADPVRLREVLSNVVANALRHTPAGGRVSVSANATPEAVELVVADTGEGIARELLPTVFDRYLRSDSGGSGLGLAIARSLVRAHGGTIMAESAGIAGQGTRIRVRLPLDD